MTWQSGLYISNANEHTVDVGQTLYSVARQYNVSVKDLAEWNNFAADEKIKVGQVLIVKGTSRAAPPVVAPPAKVVTKPTPSTATSGSTFHVVQPSETLYSISKKYGVTVQQVQNWNGLSNNNVRLGQKLVIKK